MTEIAPPLARHEAQRGAEATHGIGRRDGFLQNEVSAQLKRLTGSGASVQNGERDRVLVAWALAQALKHAEPALQIVAVHNYRVELLGRKDFVPGMRSPADLDVDRQFRQRWAHYVYDLRVAAY